MGLADDALAHCDTCRYIRRAGRLRGAGHGGRLGARADAGAVPGVPSPTATDEAQHSYEYSYSTVSGLTASTRL